MHPQVSPVLVSIDLAKDRFAATVDHQYTETVRIFAPLSHDCRQLSLSRKGARSLTWPWRIDASHLQSRIVIAIKPHEVRPCAFSC